MVNLARNTPYVCDIPLIVHADAGFGEISMLPRVVKEFEKSRSVGNTFRRPDSSKTCILSQG